MRIIVVGAGVVGLSCAVRLLEDGHRVDVVARDLPLETTSAVAAAIWYPYRALPQDRVTSWAATSYAVFDALAAPVEFGGSPESGVRMVPWHEVLRRRARTGPWWRAAVPHLGRVRHPCPRATWTGGRSPPRSSRCRSTCAGWLGGSRSWAGP